MFGKKCPKCKRRISKSYDFCPFCGNNFRSEYHKEDYGMLGRNDFIEKDNFFNNFNGSFIDRLFKNAIKELPSMMKIIEKQMQDSGEKTNKIKNDFGRFPNNLNVQFFINGKKVIPEQEPQSFIPKENKISKERIEKIIKLPKIEPSSRVRRLSGKIVYEIAVPGVNDIDDVLINQLENSIEIKALGKDKVYSKILKINLPILKYKLEKGSLLLELKG